MNTKEYFESTALLVKVLIDAALANHDIQSYLSDPKPPRLWTVEGVLRHPTCRVEWEHATVIGGIGESLATARHKHWGEFIGIFPLRPDDPVGWSRILYIYKECSPYNRRVEQRKAMKRILGRQYRKIVTLAATSTKKDFLNLYLTETDSFIIRRRLQMDPSRFWRIAKGREFIDLPKPPVQLLLFPDPDEHRALLSLGEDHSRGGSEI
jgi:hypothetical protein